MKLTVTLLAPGSSRNPNVAECHCGPGHLLRERAFVSDRLGSAAWSRQRRMRDPPEFV
jgi:hypothetical protein